MSKAEMKTQVAARDMAAGGSAPCLNSDGIQVDLQHQIPGSARFLSACL
jgi:hypothetical protein